MATRPESENRNHRRCQRPSRMDRGESIRRNPLMKRILSFVAVLSLVVAAVAFARAGDDKAEHKMEGHTHSMAAAKTGTWTGEILDASCYLGHGAMGAKHTECAAKCAANGAPMMLLTKDGKVILLTPPHDNADAYNQAKTLAGTMATITGALSERSGVKGIEVTGVTAATAEASTK